MLAEDAIAEGLGAEAQQVARAELDQAVDQQEHEHEQQQQAARVTEFAQGPKSQPAPMTARKR